MSGAGIKGVLFDKDGTLFDFARTWEAWALAFVRKIAKDDAQAQALGDAVGFDLVTARFSTDSIVIAGSPDEIATALLPHLPGQTLSGLLFVMNSEAAKAPQIEVTPLVPFLTGLKAAGLRVGVATNDAEAPARAHLGEAGVTELFDFIAGYDSGHGAKPGPGQLRAFASAMGLEAEVCAMVGDSLHDLRAGRAAGFKTVGVLTGMASADVLQPFADVILPDISHLPGWLGHG